MVYIVLRKLSLDVKQGIGPTIILKHLIMNHSIIRQKKAKK